MRRQARRRRRCQPVSFEGPGGRVPLTQWTLRKDPANRGLALGWQRGGFAGATVSVPNVVDPTPYTGKAGGAQLRRLGRVVSHELRRPAGGRRTR